MSDDLLTRDEVLRGLPAGRAQTLLFLIECRTAYLASRSGVGLEPFLSDVGVEERERAFLDAFTLGKQPPRSTSVQELESYISRSATLIPRYPNVRAAVAHLLGQKYQLTYEKVPNIRWVLGMDEPDVQQAYEAMYHRPIASLYATKTSTGERVRWIWSTFGDRLNALPPFWFAFVFTMALGIPQSILAMPIAAAQIGPIIGIALTVAAGAVSFLTVGCMAEAAARSGVVRYGAAYIGRVTKEYLGVSGSTVLSLATLAVFIITVLATFFAISRTLAGVAHGAAPLLTLALFVVGLMLLVRGSLRFSVTLLVAIASLVLVLLLGVMALSVDHFQPGYLVHGVQNSGNVSSRWQNAVGVVLMGYFGEAFVIQCAKAVLPRDESGGSLIWGSAAGLATITVLIVVWVVVINGSLGPGRLAHQAGTALTPLATTEGPVVAVIGTALVLILAGLAGLRGMLGTIGQVREWLPRPLEADALSREQSQRSRISAALRDSHGQQIAASAPIVAVLALGLWLTLIGHDSFAGALGLLGVVSNTVFTGLMPVLLLAASRKKGEIVPERILHFLGQPLILGGIYLLYLVVLLVHGFVIWHNPLEQAAAAVTAIGVVAATGIMIRQGALQPRMIVELRKDLRTDDHWAFAVTAAGQAVSARASFTCNGRQDDLEASVGTLAGAADLTEATFHLPPVKVRDIKVWAHVVSPAGMSEGLASHVEIVAEDGQKESEVRGASEQVLVPASGGPVTVRITPHR